MRAPSLLTLAAVLATASITAPSSHVALAGSGLEVTMGIINTHRSVKLDPSVQHIPLDPTLAHLRPPPPRVPTGSFDIFVGLSVFRDGYRCAKTIFTGLTRATHPERVYFGVVDQVNPGDATCIEEFCKMTAARWSEQGACPYRDHVRIDERLADDSRGPTLARHYQQKLIKNEEFCLQLDGHSIFTNKWDENILAEWTRVGNEMAVLSTYLHHIHDFVKDNGDNKPPSSFPHLCTTIRGSNQLVRNEGASMIGNSKWPQLSALWGAGLSFSKCHAERRVLIDSHTLWMFDGEEFLRASHMWTHGYDLYSPSALGSVVYHNYSKVPARFEHVKVDQTMKKLESERGRNRFNLIVGRPFVGEVDTREMDKFAFGTVRSFQDYLAFSGVTFEEGKNDTDTCRQLHWVPYRNATEVEAIVGGGWKLDPQAHTITAKPTAATNEKKKKAGTETDLNGPDDPVELQRVDKHAQAGAGGEGDALAADKLNAAARANTGDGAATLPSPQPEQEEAGIGGVLFYVFLFGSVVYVVMANEGVAGNVANLWQSKKPHDSRA